MQSNITFNSRARSKQTHVRPVQPNPEGGRPADPLIEAFEGCLEGLIAERDDRVALRRAVDGLRAALNVNATIVRSLIAKRPSRGVESRARHLQIVISRLVHEVSAREARLATAVDPELQRIVSDTDRAISERARLHSC